MLFGGLVGQRADTQNPRRTRQQGPVLRDEAVHTPKVVRHGGTDNSASVDFHVAVWIEEGGGYDEKEPVSMPNATCRH